MAPLVKTGGLGDVVGALPDALAVHGNDVIVVIPFYRAEILHSVTTKRLRWEGTVPVGTEAKPYAAYEIVSLNTAFKTILIDNNEYFGRAGLYVNPKTGQDFKDNDLRFSFFSKAVIELVQRMNWQPDIFHVHDWQTSLIPAYLRTSQKVNRVFTESKSVLTIHNLAYQGKFKKDRFSLLGLSEELIRPTASLEFYGETNFLKGGISFADKITTVSETYAREIQDSLGCGLEGVLRSRSKDLSGIVNGVDYSVWSPNIDKNLKFRYRDSNISGKRKNKVELLSDANLPVREDALLVGMVSRLVEQKGLRLIIEGSKQLFAMNLQLIILGSGDKQIEQDLLRLEKQYPDRFKLYLKFDERLAHMIEAGADIFLMPSLFEPCGLNQMYSLKYGTPPVVHRVGGLADTVIDYDEISGEGTGFVFEKFNVQSMIVALARAVTLFGKKRKWTKLIKNGMKQDFSWKTSAQKYINLFETLVTK